MRIVGNGVASVARYLRVIGSTRARPRRDFSWHVAGGPLHAATALGAALMLSGCVAAIPAVMMAGSVAAVGSSAFGVYKLVQLQTGGGEVEIRFRHPLPEGAPREAAHSLRKIAVWPASDENAYLAERLARQSALSVTSPARIRVLMADRRDLLSLKGLLDADRTELFRLACRRAAVDAVYFARTIGTGYDASTFSFDSPNTTVAFQHGLYDCAARRFRLNEIGEVKVTVGTTQDMEEIDRIANHTIAERLIEFIGA